MMDKIRKQYQRIAAEVGDVTAYAQRQMYQPMGSVFMQVYREHEREVDALCKELFGPEV